MKPPGDGWLTDPEALLVLLSLKALLPGDVLRFVQLSTEGHPTTVVETMKIADTAECKRVCKYYANPKLTLYEPLPCWRLVGWRRPA